MIASLNRPVNVSNALVLAATASVFAVVGIAWYGLESLSDANQNLQRLHQQDLQVIDHLNHVLGIKAIEPVAGHVPANHPSDKGQPPQAGSYAIAWTRYSTPVTGRIISTGPR